MQTETIETYQIKSGDRVEFRQYGYKQDFACGRVLKVDAKSVTVVVDRSQRRAKVHYSDIVKVLNNA
jgi:ribosome maturation factor RimP